MEAKFEVHLLVPVEEASRGVFAQKLSGYFKLPAQKLERVLIIPGIITKPLGKETADKVAQKLLELGIQVAVIPENLADNLIFDEPITDDSLQDFLAQIPEIPSVRRVYSDAEPPRASRPVVFGVFSLLFLILTLVFGVSFTQAPVVPSFSESITELASDFPLRYEVIPLSPDTLSSVVD